MPIRLVVAESDDPPLVLEVLEDLLQEAPDFEVVARCQRGEETLHAVDQHRPDVVILAIRMPGMGGLEVLRELRQAQLPTRVVLLTESLHDDDLLEAILLGVGGVVLNNMPLPELATCIRKVYTGDDWLERGTVGRAVETLLRREVDAREQGQGLTPREIEVVPLAATSLPHQASADQDQGGV